MAPAKTLDNFHSRTKTHVPHRGSDLPYISRLQPDDVLVEVKYMTLCDTSFPPFRGGNNQDTIAGYAGVGVVVALGEGVDDINVGDIAGVQSLIGTCGKCIECSSFDNPVCCEELQLAGLTVKGTLQTQRVCKTHEIVRIPGGISLDAIPPILCAGGTIERAIAMTSLPQGHILGIVGPLGPVGSLACKYARSLGYQVLAMLSPEEAKDPRVDNLDADFVVHCDSSSNMLSEVRSIIPRGLPAILVCETAEPPFQFAPQVVRPHGKIVLIGASTQIDFSSVVQRAVSVQWAWAGTRADIEKVLRHVVSMDIQVPRRIELVNEGARGESLSPGDTSHGWTVLELPQSLTRELSKPNDQPLVVGPLNFGQYLVHRLAELGVKDFFAVPGDSNLNLLDAVLETKKLNFIGCCNELNAGYAADGYARTSNSHIAVVVVPFVVGGLSSLNAICGAFTDRQKVIVISGCPVSNVITSKKNVHHTPGAASLDVALNAYRGVTAASLRITKGADAVATLDKALEECVRQSLPAYIEVAHDVAFTECPSPTPLIPLEACDNQRHDHRGVIQAFTQAWQSARMPVVLLGPEAFSSCSLGVLMSFVERLGCAVLVQPDARSFPESHPQFCGSFWPSISNSPGESVMLESDLWIVLGTRWFDLHTMGVFDIDQQTHRLLDLQPDSAQLLLGEKTPIALQDLLQDLIRMSIHKNSQSLIAYHERTPKIITSNGRHEPKSDSPVTLSNIIDEINELVQEHDTLFSDAGEAWFIAQQIKLPAGATCHSQIVYASLGWSLPATLGCQVARPMGRTILLVGDGAYQMTAQEISTMIRYKLNPIIFVFNNLGYQVEIAIQDGIYNYIANWDYAGLASCYTNPSHSSNDTSNIRPAETKTDTKEDSSFIAFQVRTHADLYKAVTQAQQEPTKLCLIECCIQPGDITASLRAMGARVTGSESESAGVSAKESSTPDTPPTSIDESITSNGGADWSKTKLERFEKPLTNGLCSADHMP